MAKAWADEDYKQRLLADPASVLSEEGMKVPEGVQVRIVEATEKQVWLVIPPKPEDGKIEEGTARLAAGDPNACACTMCGCACS